MLLEMTKIKLSFKQPSQLQNSSHPNPCLGGLSGETPPGKVLRCRTRKAARFASMWGTMVINSAGTGSKLEFVLPIMGKSVIETINNSKGEQQ
jgi:hypothetical protein